jgi:hypothetical protein
MTKSDATGSSPVRRAARQPRASPRNIVIDAETAQLVAAAVQAGKPSGRRAGGPRGPVTGYKPVF